MDLGELKNPLRLADRARLPAVVAPAWVREQLIGRDAVVSTPFGERTVVDADPAASARSLR